MSKQLYGKTYNEILSQPSFGYEADIRGWPDNPRRRAFTQGWHDATLRKRQYTDATLSRLTWCNFGWRMGKGEGTQSIDQIHAAYAWLADRWHERHAEG